MSTEISNEILDSGKLAVTEFLNRIGIHKVVFGDYDKSINGTPLLLHSDNDVDHPHISIEVNGYTTDYTFRYLRIIGGCYSVGTEIRTHQDNDGDIIKNYSLPMLEDEIVECLRAKNKWSKKFKRMLIDLYGSFKKFKFRQPKPR